MTEIERYRKLRLELEDIGGKLAGLPQRINALKVESAAARDEAVRMELLGDPEAGRRRAGIKAAQDEVRKIEADREDLLHRRGILQSVMMETQKKAEAELGAIHARQFARGVKALSAALRAAHKAEGELAVVRAEADRAFIEIDSRLVPLPMWAPLLIRGIGQPDAMQPTVENFFNQMKGQGFDLS